MFPSTLTSFSLPCVTKDIQNFVLRKHKYLRAVNQFNEDEPLPSNLLFPFFKKLKDTKQLKAFNFKWSHFPGLQTKPEIVKSVFKRHCQYIHKHNVLATDMAFPKHHKNLIVPLKNVTTASLDNSKDIRKLMTLKTVENLTIDLRYGKIDYKVLYHTLYRLAKLRNLIVVTPQKSVEQTLMVLHELTIRRPEIEFQIFVGGKQDQHDIPYLATPLVEKVTQMSFQNINPALLLDNLFFQERSFVFTGLKVLRLEFNNMTPQATSYLSYIKEVSGLEDFTLKIVDCHDSNVAAGIIKGLRLPSSLQTLELNIPLHFSSLLTHTKRLVNKVSAPKKGYYPWRTRNIFEEELLFASFLENFTEAQNLRRITFDFQMLEDFHSHYTNFIISILGRLLNLVFLEIQVTKIQQDDMEATQSLGCFDLSPFFKVCSQMPQIEQIEILMPNLLFDGANFTPITPNLKNFTIGVDEADEDKPIKFFNISKSVDKLMKTLMKCSPNLVNLGLDFSETVTQATLLKRFYMIQKFQRLEALGARYFVGDCSQETVRQVGIVVKSLSRLNMLLLKFLETEKKIYGIQNYIKYHQSLRNMMIQFNDSAWMDNECLINPLGAQIKETKIDTEEDENDVDNMNMQAGSLNELIPMDLMQETN